jgi:hypothetical protein
MLKTFAVLTGWGGSGKEGKDVNKDALFPAGFAQSICWIC